MSKLTHVEFLWLEKGIENWIRFGHATEDKVVDERRRILSLVPGSSFAFVRWTSNNFDNVHLTGRYFAGAPVRPALFDRARCASDRHATANVGYDDFGVPLRAVNRNESTLSVWSEASEILLVAAET